MTAKQAIQDWASQLPDETNWNEVREEFYVFSVLKEREEFEHRGEHISAEEMKKRFSRCFTR
jgi:hypothetical protein